MTLPHESKNALHSARDFLHDLINPSSTKRVPLSIRRLARSIVKHYPAHYQIDELSVLAPHILGQDDLTASKIMVKIKHGQKENNKGLPKVHKTKKTSGKKEKG